MGLDTSKPLSEQKCSLDTSVSTWYDYFMNAAKEKLSQCLIVFEDAKKNGKELTGNEKKQSREILTQLEAAAKEKGISKKQYLSTNYGKNVTEEDVLKCAELERLTARYYSDYIKTLDTGDAALEKYLSGKKKTYCTVNYIYFQVPAADISDSAMETARKTAQQLSAQKTPEKLIEEIGAYAENYYADNGSLKGKKLKTKVEEIKKKIVLLPTYPILKQRLWAGRSRKSARLATAQLLKTNSLQAMIFIISHHCLQEKATMRLIYARFSLTFPITAIPHRQKKPPRNVLKLLKKADFQRRALKAPQAVFPVMNLQRTTADCLKICTRAVF